MSDAHPLTRNRTLLIGAGVAAAIAVALLVVPSLLGGDDMTELPVAAAPAAPAPPTEIEPETELAEPGPLPETFEVFSARDPFQQLVEVENASTEAAATASVTTTDTTTATPTTGGAVDPATSPTTADQPATTGGAEVAATTAAAPDPAVGATNVRLLGAQPAEGEVTVAVNGIEHTASEGDVFAERFRLLDVDGDCATLLFGDSRFSLCQGESIAK